MKAYSGPDNGPPLSLSLTSDWKKWAKVFSMFSKSRPHEGLLSGPDNGPLLGPLLITDWKKWAKGFGMFL